MCSSAPNTDGQQQAAVMQATLSQEQLDWAKQIYADAAPQRAAAEERANEVSDAQLSAMRTQEGLANEYADYNRTTFRPLEESLVRDANNFDTEGKREELAGLALGDVNQNFASAREQGTRALTRMGVNPSDGDFGAGNTQLALSQSLAGADAQNKARMNASMLGNAMKMDAASLGRGLPGNQTAAASLAMNQGNSSVGSSQATLAGGNAGQSQVNQAYGGARQGFGSAGNIYGSISNTQAATDAANSSNVAAGVGAAASTYGSLVAAGVIGF